MYTPSGVVVPPAVKPCRWETWAPLAGEVSLTDGMFDVGAALTDGPALIDGVALKMASPGLVLGETADIEDGVAGSALELVAM